MILHACSIHHENMPDYFQILFLFFKPQLFFFKQRALVLVSQSDFSRQDGICDMYTRHAGPLTFNYA